jgi:N-methylhydantoinase A
MDETARARLAVDIGGTFTDVVLERPAQPHVTAKLLTTHAHPGAAVLEGIATVLDRAKLAAADVGLIIHGTTLATNALIERRGAVTALLTTAGHRDVLAMAHEDRFEQYDVMIDRPRPLVPRHLRLPVTERLDRDGGIRVPLDEASLEATLPVLDEHGVGSVAIGYLHAFVNPEHEQRSADWLARRRPDISITLASEVCPEIREYERLSTACANAYVRPLMARYLERLSGELHELGFRCPFLLMTSGGGLTTLETAAKFPIRLVESGPAGGAILAQAVARQAGMSRVLSFDMGGTTAKLALVDDFEPLTSRSFEVDRVYRFRKGSGLPVRIPVIEMVEIGAGGGSLASVDKLGRIQVGPESAGSEPGPAAYGRGGARPAVTDADVLLGRVVPDTFAGGAFALDAAAARAAMAEAIGDPLGMDETAAAFGISEVVDENMAAAARAHAAEFGLDLGSRDMIAFGGAAPLHAVRLGEKLGVRRIIVPTAAGVGSAVGFLLAPVAYEVVRSRRQTLSALNTDLVNRVMDEMRAEALAVVRMGAPGRVAAGRITETRQAYMRYSGQGHEIPVDLPPGPYAGNHADEFRARFEDAYRRLYGRTIDGVEIEVLSWTLTVSAARAQAREPAAEAAPADAPVARPAASQPLFDPAGGQAVPAAVWMREALAPGARVDGPALITEAQTTTVVAPGWRATIGPHGHILLERSP